MKNTEQRLSKDDDTRPADDEMDGAPLRDLGRPANPLELCPENARRVKKRRGAPNGVRALCWLLLNRMED